MCFLRENLGDPLTVSVENPIAEGSVYGNKRLTAGSDHVQSSVIVRVYDHCPCRIEEVDATRHGWSLGMIRIGNTTVC
jgi:hypothetical protein